MLKLEIPNLYLTLKATKLGGYLLNHSLTTKSYDPNLGNQINPLNIVVTAPDGDNENQVKAANTIEMQKKQDYQ